jgi:Xaa-Pro aminopeptidase
MTGIPSSRYERFSSAAVIKQERGEITMSEEMRKKELRKPISEQELERRFRAVREAMEKGKFDCLIMQNNNQFIGGYTRYFTGLPATSYAMTVLFPLNTGMTILSHGAPAFPGPAAFPPGPPEWAVYGVKERINFPYVPTLARTNEMDAKAAVDTLRKLNVRSLGVVSPASMSVFMYNYIKENLPGLTITYATDFVDEIKAVKSEEEIQVIQETARMQDILWGAALALVRPGVREYEIMAEMQRLFVNWGSEEQLIMIGSQPAGKPAVQKRDFFQNRTLQEGDQVCIMPEVNGAGGFYCELGRTVCIGDAPKPLLDLWDFMVQLEDATAKMLKPGANPADIYRFYNDELAKKGCAPDHRLFCHGQGYDLVERPSMRPEEDMMVKANMNIAIHPMTMNSTRSAFAFCSDNYIVTDSGAMRIHRTPREVFVV